MTHDPALRPFVLFSQLWLARQWQKRWLALALPCMACSLVTLASMPAHADDDLELERSLAEFVVIDNRQAESGKAQGQQAGAGQPSEKGQTDLAVLPQLGYDPEAGFIYGVEFSAIDFTASHFNLEVNATQSTEGQTGIDIKLGSPHLFGSDFIGQVRARYELHPSQDFYGLGNNDVGDDELTEHEYHSTSLLFTLGRRLRPHLVLAGTLGFNRTSIGPGDPQSGDQSTGDVFPHLPGLQGRYNNPVSLALIYNTQDDLTRPDKGWNVVGKVTHVGSELGNDFHYTRFISDASYIQPIFSSDHLIGVRVGGEYLLGDGDDLPFYEFASIGGYHTLAGFEPNRFLGQGRVFIRAAYQELLTEFDFYNIWHVRLDGSVFGGAGRVFLDESRLPSNVDTDKVAPGANGELRYSYGAGLHIALGQALSARLLAGFSKESKGLIYLTFGNAF
jgi:outer membrane protein assembly factor BamA